MIKKKKKRLGRERERFSYTAKKASKKQHYRSSLLPPLCRKASNCSDNMWLKTTSQRHREQFFVRLCSRQSERGSVLQSWHLQVWQLKTSHTWPQNTTEKGRVFLSSFCSSPDFSVSPSLLPSWPLPGAAMKDAGLLSSSVLIFEIEHKWAFKNCSTRKGKGLRLVNSSAGTLWKLCPPTPTHWHHVSH